MQSENEFLPIPDVPNRDGNDLYHTDLAASNRFVEAAVDSLRFCPGVGWLVWDGKRWAKEGEAAALELAKRCARDWVNRWEEKVAEAPADGELRKMLARALGLEKATHIKAAVELAKTSPRLLILVDQLDRAPWLFSAANGTLCLRSASLRAHSREDFITKLAPTDYRPDAKSPIFDAYLAHLASEKPDFDGFLARCLGATLTGDASAETLHLLLGPGASGKTTLIEAIAVAMGDYAVKLRYESLCASKRGRVGASASPDLLALRGARLAYASEGDQSARLDAGVIKELTGNETVTARGLYKDPITFRQTWKLWMVSNYDPKAAGDDTGIWRRVYKIKFSAVPPERRDPRIKEALTNDPDARAALLAWCVRGCLEWQKNGGGRAGLAAPACVIADTLEYRQSQDLLDEWWKEVEFVGKLGADHFTPTRDIRGHYDCWAKEEGAIPVGPKRFKEYLLSKGLRSDRTPQDRGWRGILVPSGTLCVSFKRWLPCETPADDTMTAVP
jgi:putative DNA primase/helicase